MAGDQESADPGVAVNANAENATADAVAILQIVLITLSNKFEVFGVSRGVAGDGVDGALGSRF